MLSALVLFSKSLFRLRFVAFLGALRSVAQMVAYELCLGTIVVTMCFSTGSYSLNEFAIKQEEQLFF